MIRTLSAQLVRLVDGEAGCREIFSTFAGIDIDGEVNGTGRRGGVGQGDGV